MPVSKPEELTHLNAHRLVPKDHPRIRFRGQLDLLQAHIIAVQTELEGEKDGPALIADLDGILELLRQVSALTLALNDSAPALVERLMK